MKKYIKKHPLILSVDWDYFLPRSTDEFDWGHSEIPFCFELAWLRRAKDKVALDKIRVKPKTVENFWDYLVEFGDIPQVCICDSHADIVDFTQDLAEFEIINFDAHHDVNYNDTGKLKPLDCGNWAGHLRQQGKLKRYTLVYPKWRKKCPEREDGKLPQGVDTLIYGDLPYGIIPPDRVFVCRSSCWMPPWCDQEWLKLIKPIHEGAIRGWVKTYAMEAREWPMATGTTVLPTTEAGSVDQKIAC